MANNIQAVKDLILSNLDEGTIITPELHREVENAIVSLIPPGPFVFTVKASPDPDNIYEIPQGDTIEFAGFAGWDIISVAAGNVHYTAPYFQKTRPETTITMRQGISFFEGVAPETMITVTLGIINNEV